MLRARAPPSLLRAAHEHNDRGGFLHRAALFTYRKLPIAITQISYGIEFGLCAQWIENVIHTRILIKLNAQTGSKVLYSDWH